MKTRKLTNEQAHRAFDSAIREERVWAQWEYRTVDHAEKARANRMRWHWVDVATRAAQMHNRAECALCLKEELGGDRWDDQAGMSAIEKEMSE